MSTAWEMGAKLLRVKERERKGGVCVCLRERESACVFEREMGESQPSFKGLKRMYVCCKKDSCLF